MLRFGDFASFMPYYWSVHRLLMLLPPSRLIQSRLESFRESFLDRADYPMPLQNVSGQSKVGRFRSEMSSEALYSHLSKSTYEVTSKIGRAIIVDVHFHWACLYSGLEVSTMGFDWSDNLVWLGLGGGMGAELGLGDTEAFTGVVFGAVYCCDGVDRADPVAVLCFLAADIDAIAGSGLSAFGVDVLDVLAGAFEAGAGSDFAVVVVFTATRGFGSALALDVALVFDAFALVTSVFFACVVALTSFSNAVAAAVAALVGDFFDLVETLALGAFGVGAATAVSFEDSFIAWAFLGRVVDTCRTL